MRCDVDARQIDLVERHDDRHAGRPGMADRFFGLRHDAVVGRHDQHGDVGDVGAAGPHFGEGLVARRIDERDLAAVLLDLIGANVLRDAAAFAADHVDADDLVQQRRLAVVDVAQERDDRRPRLELLGIVRLARRSSRASGLRGRRRCLSSISTPSSTASSSTVSGVDLGVDRRSIVPRCHQLAQHLRGRHADRLGEAADGAGQLQHDFALARRGGASCRSA